MFLGMGRMWCSKLPLSIMVFVLGLGRELRRVRLLSVLRRLSMRIWVSLLLLFLFVFMILVVLLSLGLLLGTLRRLLSERLLSLLLLLVLRRLGWGFILGSVRRVL